MLRLWRVANAAFLMAADPAAVSRRLAPCRSFMRSSSAAAAGDSPCVLTWLDEVDSTQDETRRRIEAGQEPPIFAVAATSQTAGRGTRGRVWLGAPGNVFLTLALPMGSVPVSLTLLPLQIGVIIAKSVQDRLDSPLPVSVKWPNDVLIGDDKVAGVLIEGDGTSLLIGIGINVGYAPEVPTSGPQRGRTATSMGSHGGDTSSEAVQDLTACLANEIATWSTRPDTAERLLSDWTSWCDWSKPLKLREEGTTVTPLAIEPDGQLRIRAEDGTIRTLAAEYLY